MKPIFSKILGVFNLKVLVPAVIIVFAAAGSFAMISTAPKADRRPPVATVPSVETGTFEKGVHKTVISVMGTVVPAHQVTLNSRVEGEVTSVSDMFVPGGFFQAGEEILRIDPQDYELALNEVRAEVTTAEYNLKVEQGYQNVAGREWALLKKSAKGTAQEADLALRKPHLEKANADVSAARAKLQKAQLDLNRTRITAPFAAMVESKNTDLGASISTSEDLATLVGTDEFWVQVTVPVDRIGWIAFPDSTEGSGARAVITCGSNGNTCTREGRVIRLLPSLEDNGRMARVLVSVTDPLNLSGEKGVSSLLLGSYVNVDIEGRELADVYAIPRDAFRENGKIWVLTEEGNLDIRQVTPVWRSADSIFLKEGVAPGERIVLSGLPTPMQGMKLRSVSLAAEPSKDAEVKNNG